MRVEQGEAMDEYEKLVVRMNTPRVVIDNAACPTATLIKVDSARRHGGLLQAVQVLTDLNVSIHKAYISSDGRWFMDVLHVTDRHGNKLAVADHSLQSFIEDSLGVGFPEKEELEAMTVLELTGADRRGLLSEVFAVLSDMECTVAEAKVWTHNGRTAALVFLSEDDSSSGKIRRVERLLENVLKEGSRSSADGLGARVAVAASPAYPDRRLHQLMFADRDYERLPASGAGEASVSVQGCAERGYSVVTVQCRDRAKLLYDVVCGLTDMEYVVFHGTINTVGDEAHQEFYIRHADGRPIGSEAERQHVARCLRAAIGRRANEGMRLEVCREERRGVLSEVTRALRESGLSVARADVSTKGCRVSSVFVVTDAYGRPAEAEAIEALRQHAGMEGLRVVEETPFRSHRKTLVEGGAGIFYLGSLFKRNLYNLGLIRSCS